MSGENKTDKVVLAFLIIFMVLTFLLSFLVFVGMNEFRDYRAEIDQLKYQNNEYIAYIEQHKQLFDDLEDLKNLNKELRTKYQIYEARSEQLETVVNTRYRQNGDQEYKIVFLTFDDGPTETTEGILDVLKEYHVQATFFVNGRDSEFSRRMYRRIVDEGHALGNHTYTHDYSTLYENLEAFKTDFYDLQDFLFEVTGEKPVVFRYPGGSNNQISHRYGGNDIMDIIVPEMNDLGYVYADWNVDSGDTSVKVRSEEYLSETVIRQSRWYDVAVVLMHDFSRNITTKDSLPVIIETLRDDGYVFLPMTERYIDIVPQFYKRHSQ